MTAQYGIYINHQLVLVGRLTPNATFLDTTISLGCFRCGFLFRWRTWIIVKKFRITLDSREVTEDASNFVFWLTFKRPPKKCEWEIFPLVDQLKLQIASVYKLVLQWMKIRGQKPIKVQTYRHSENLKLCHVHKVKLNRTGYIQRTMHVAEWVRTKKLEEQ